MARINHNNYLDTIDDLFTDAKNRGIMHLNTNSNNCGGGLIEANDQSLVNFGTCGYMALEYDQRLINGAIDYVKKFGTQFSVSRAYISSGINVELEEQLSKIYNLPVIVYSSTSTAHISVIPSLVRERDAIILDQQVHFSVQTGANLLRQKNIPIEMIRHSNIEMLERTIQALGNKYEKIWYMIDGVYSMFGDIAPVEELKQLLNKYHNFYLYVDDAHGMSWFGKNGAGYFFEKMGSHPKVVLITTLAKGFGTMGGLAIFSDPEMYRKTKIFGGPLSYSHPLAPSLIGASMASAQIHLSNEIYSIQNDLKELKDCCNEALNELDLPVLSNPETPIYFVGMGLPKVGYNMLSKILKDGFFANVAIFPAVSVKNTGLRFTITRHQTKGEIVKFAEVIKRNFDIVLKEENITENDVRKLFKLPLKKVKTPTILAKHSHHKIEHYTSITGVNKKEWNELLGKHGNYDFEGMQFMEEAFAHNSEPEKKWEFHYFIVRDQQQKPLIATFFTIGLYKDDMLASEHVSMKVEEERVNDPYYFTSRTVAMGTLLSEGQHLYIDRESLVWKDALKALLDEVTKLQANENASAIILRDIDSADHELKEFLISEGYVRGDMGNSNIVQHTKWNTIEEYEKGLSRKNRMHVRAEVFRNQHMFDVTIKSSLTPKEAEYAYQLYLNVKNRNFGVNLFEYPKDILLKMSKYPHWEFIVISLKPEFDTRKERKPVSVTWCYKTAYAYCPMIMGMDYDYVFTHKVYKQSLFQMVKRGHDLGLPQINLGFSADLEKRKVGAKQIAKSFYIQNLDNFKLELLEVMGTQNPLRVAA